MVGISRRGSSFPSTDEQVEPWARSIAAEHTRTPAYQDYYATYLTWFGSRLIVPCTGSPEWLDRQADLWEEIGRSAEQIYQKLRIQTGANATHQGELHKTVVLMLTDAQETLQTNPDRTSIVEPGERINLGRVPAATEMVGGLRATRQVLRFSRLRATTLTTEFINQANTILATVDVGLTSPPGNPTFALRDVFERRFRGTALNILRDTTRRLRAAALPPFKSAEIDRGVDLLSRLSLSTPTRRARELAKYLSEGDYSRVMNSYTLTMGAVGTVNQLTKDAVRMYIPLGTPVPPTSKVGAGWPAAINFAVRTAPSSGLRQLILFSMQRPLDENPVINIAEIAAINTAGAYGANGVAGLVAGAKAKANNPATIAFANTATSLAMGFSSYLQKKGTLPEPELINQSGEPRFASDNTFVANTAYNVSALSLVPGLIMGGSAAVNSSSNGAPPAPAFWRSFWATVGLNSATGVVGGLAAQRPPEPEGWWGGVYDQSAAYLNQARPYLDDAGEYLDKVAAHPITRTGLGVADIALGGGAVVIGQTGNAVSHTYNALFESSPGQPAPTRSTYFDRKITSGTDTIHDGLDEIYQAWRPDWKPTDRSHGTEFGPDRSEHGNT
jgi:hypothetical protein